MRMAVEAGGEVAGKIDVGVAVDIDQRCARRRLDREREGRVEHPGAGIAARQALAGTAVLRPAGGIGGFHSAPSPRRPRAPGRGSGRLARYLSSRHAPLADKLRTIARPTGRAARPGRMRPQAEYDHVRIDPAPGLGNAEINVKYINMAKSKQKSRIGGLRKSGYHHGNLKRGAGLGCARADPGEGPARLLADRGCALGRRQPGRALPPFQRPRGAADGGGAARLCQILRQSWKMPGPAANRTS